VNVALAAHVIGPIVSAAVAVNVKSAARKLSTEAPTDVATSERIANPHLVPVVIDESVTENFETPAAYPLIVVPEAFTRNVPGIVSLSFVGPPIVVDVPATNLASNI
jgi:hypothetical protein